MAPAASIVLVETPTAENEGRTGFPQIVTAENYVLRHHLGQVISQSFGATEQTFTSPAQLLACAAPTSWPHRDHVTVLAASGDNGASGETLQHEQPVQTGRSSSGPRPTRWSPRSAAPSCDLSRAGPRLAARTWPGATAAAAGRRSSPGRPTRTACRGVDRRHRGIPDISMDASCASSVAHLRQLPRRRGQLADHLRHQPGHAAVRGRGGAGRPGRRARAGPDQPGHLQDGGRPRAPASSTSPRAPTRSPAAATARP